MKGYVLIPPQEDAAGWRITCPQEDGICSVRKPCKDCPFNEGLWVAEQMHMIVGEER